MTDYTTVRSSAARYTSPALSRALREAGVSQTGERFWYYDLQVSKDPFLFERAIPWGPDRFRAWRLDEILEELEAENPEHEWVIGKSGAGYIARLVPSWLQRIAAEPMFCDEWAESPVEAAGLMLLAATTNRGRLGPFHVARQGRFGLLPPYEMSDGALVKPPVIWPRD